MGREARRPERSGPGARRRGDPTPDPAGRIERPGQGREGGTRPLQPAGERTPGPTQRIEAEEAPPRRRAAREAPAGIEAPRVPADDVRPDGRQGTRTDRRDPTPAGGGQETREVARGERGRPEDEGRTEVRARPRRGRPQARLRARGEGPGGARPDDRALRAGRRPAPGGRPGAGGVHQDEDARGRGAPQAHRAHPPGPRLRQDHPRNLDEEPRRHRGGRRRGRREERGGTDLRTVQERREAVDRGPPHAAEVRIPLTGWPSRRVDPKGPPAKIVPEILNILSIAHRWVATG